MPKVFKELSRSDLPVEWQAEIGNAMTVRVTLEPLDSSEVEENSLSFQELMDSIVPSKLEDGMDCVTLVRRLRDGR